MLGTIDAEAIPLHKDHVSMAKFESNSNEDFQTIASQLNNMVKYTSASIAARWESYNCHEGAWSCAIQLFAALPHLCANIF